MKIGNGAYIGSGSVITKDVPDDALAGGAQPADEREGGAKRFRELKSESQAAEGGLMQWRLSFPLNAVAIRNNY